MPFHANLLQLINILDALPYGLSNPAMPAIGLNTDSRQIRPGEVFLALRGETFDGHDFIQRTIAQGAIAAIVDSAFAASAPDSDWPMLVVSDTLQAYQRIAHWWRQQFQIPVIAITGSVGKTTTKELLAAVLSRYGTVLKTQANYNNEIGVPKTLLGIDPEHDFAVVEMGMRAPGEIALLSQIAQPSIGLITNVGTAHIGRLGSRQAIAQAKCELLAAMPETSIAILNADNPLLIDTAAQLWQGRTITYGLTGGEVSGQPIGSTSLRLGEYELPLPLPGEHNISNFLATLAVLRGLNLDPQKLQSGVSVDLPEGRAQRYDLAGDVVILDETYNAGLESMLASLQLLAQTPGQRRIAILGTMKELGNWSIPYHQQVGERVRALNLDGLMILAEAEEAKALVKGAAPLAAETFANHTAMVERLTQVVQPGDRLLFKASRAVGLDRVVAQLRDTIGT